MARKMNKRVMEVAAAIALLIALFAGAAGLAHRHFYQKCLNDALAAALSEPGPPLDLVRDLVRKGASVRTRGRGGRTALSTAAGERGDRALVSELIERGADPNTADDSGLTPLHRTTDPEIIRLLVGAGADPNAGAPLITHAQRGNIRAVEMLLDCGADLEGRDKDGRTALWWAVHTVEEQPTIGYLVKRGADIHARDSHGETPLALAKRFYRDDIVEILLRKRAARELWPSPVPSTRPTRERE